MRAALLALLLGAGDDTIANAMQDAGNTHDLLTELMAYRSPVHTLD